MKSRAMTNADIRDRLISAGVKNLREFGYPDATAENICTDQVYKQFFLSMLKDNLGHRGEVDRVIQPLITEISV